MSSANSAQQAFYNNKNNKTGPSSASKNRRGGKHRQTENKIEIVDFDINSCFLGSIEKKFSEWNAIVKNLKDDTLVNCKARGFKMKFISEKTPVVFAFSGAKNGEILCYYTLDNLRELCDHFGINYDKASKECCIQTSHDVVEDQIEEVVIASKTKDKKEKKDSGSSSDSLEPNPNHQVEEVEEEEEETLSEEQLEKLKNTSIDYNTANKGMRGGNKKMQTNKRNFDRKKKFTGVGFRYD